MRVGGTGMCVLHTEVYKHNVRIMYLLHNVHLPSSREAGGVHFDTYNLNYQSQFDEQS